MTGPVGADRPFDVLLLDFGGVCLVNPVELHPVVEDHFGLRTGTFTWRGPLDVAGDELYARSIADNDFTERDYWRTRAAEVGRTAGVDLSLTEYMTIAYSAPGDALIRPEAEDVRARASAAGLGVSVLTNDLRAFHDDAWVARIDFLQRIDHLVDLSHLEYLKPDPRAYRLALDTLRSSRPGLEADRVLFVDDQPLNVDGAIEAGMVGLFFDIAAATRSWGEVAERLGL